LTADDIVAEARAWLGTPYRPRGRSRTGLDCLGLLVMIGRRFEVPHEDQFDYSNWPRSDLLIIKTLGKHLVGVIPPAPAPGLVGCFASHGRLPHHTGVFSRQHGALHLIHACIHPPHLVEDAWASAQQDMRLIGVFAFPGMT
jgi:cell wall-associated NlpC family hydrolase